MLKKVIYNSGVQLLAKGISLGLGLISTAVLTRSLGVELYGDYVFLLAACLFLTSIADWGTQIIGVRELSRSQDKSKLFASLLGLRLLIAFLVLLTALPFVLFLPAFNAFLLASLLALVLVFLAVLDTSLEIVFQTFLRMDLKVFTELVGNLSFLLFLLVFL
ncbi:MAG: oligosaccharide flippase family protein, partial [Patescibacteria group bacterium]